MWTCKACPHFAMVYKRGVCSCPFPEWVPAGQDSCVRATHMNAMESAGYKMSEAQQITYQSVIKDNGDLSTQTITQSDTFKYFFYKASVGC